MLALPESLQAASLSLGLHHPRGLLHANFVVAVLSDLFGIQARSGCFCAGWKLLPQYRFDPDTGLWHHRDRGPESAPRLDEAFDAPPRPGPVAPESVLAGQLRKARWIIDAAVTRPPRGRLRDAAVSESFERVRWFPLPGEGLAQVLAARQ